MHKYRAMMSKYHDFAGQCPVWRRIASFGFRRIGLGAE
jgi:hypothetical protein